MAIITLGGVEYITESIGDDAIPAHNYDEVIDVSKSEDPDQWFGRVQAEWPDLPLEIKNKVIDSTSEYIGQLSKQAGAPVEVEPLDESKDSQGNDVYDFTAGRNKINGLDNSALEYTRNDLVEVIKAQEDMKKQGHNAPKLGYYWDEYWTVVDEIARRMKKGAKFNLQPWSLNGSPIDDKIDQLGE